jgi:hypothetical protein
VNSFSGCTLLALQVCKERFIDEQSFAKAISSLQALNRRIAAFIENIMSLMVLFLLLSVAIT